MPGCAVLDCTAELPKKVSTSNYLALPVWDTFGKQYTPFVRGINLSILRMVKFATMYGHKAEFRRPESMFMA